MRSAPEFSSSSSGDGANTKMASPPVGGMQHSSWQSPVPYLFAGLAAMLGLIALALLVLACSYWKLSGYLDSDGAGNSDGMEKSGDDQSSAQQKVFEEKVLVIMAGDCKPTYLATPIAGRAASSAGKASDVEAEEVKPPESSSSLVGCPTESSVDRSGDGT